LGHVQRGGKPTANDRILASRLGAHAVKGLLEGRSNEAVGVVNNAIEYTPFSDAIGKHKDINEKLWELSTILTR
jgi:6-phosphofructokinase 1